MLDVGETSVSAQHVDEVVELVEIIDRGRSQVRHLDDRHVQVSHRHVTEQRQTRVGPPRQPRLVPTSSFGVGHGSGAVDQPI